MAGSRTGTPTIWRKSVEIRNLYSKYGASDMAAKLSPGFLACIQAIVACVAEIYAVDNAPLKVDRIAPYGPEDVTPGP